LFPMISFGLLWVSWQVGEKIMLFYNGKSVYEHKTSNIGRDFSIAVTQIR
jgi:hypothetical protein